MPNVAIVWDFDGTLFPGDSTTVVVETLHGEKKGDQFWQVIKSLRGDQTMPKWEHVLAMDAPIWMYSLSRLAATKKVPLNKEFFKNFILPKIALYQNVLPFMQSLKDLANEPEFKKVDLQIHHFVITAGLKELVEEVFPKDLITWTFGCMYRVVVDEQHKDEPESIPIFCMDETMKTRSLFEISKGAFCDPEIKVNSKVENQKLWAPFSNIVYIGDGDTDVPALSLVRSKGGLGAAVYDPKKPDKEVLKKHRNMRLDKRADLITPADFSVHSELFLFLKTRCVQIRQRYEAAECTA